MSFFHSLISGGKIAYYISEDGNGVGTQSDPFGPSELALADIEEGAIVYFKKGDTFEIGGLTVSQNDITFSSYGSGANPVLIGSTDLGGATWTSETGGYYSTPLAMAPLWVTIDGEMARQGESAWIPATANTTSTTVTGSSTTLNALNTTESLIGAKLRIKEFNFRLSYEVSITNYSAGVLTYTGNTIVGGGSGMPFKLYGQKQFCTTEGDWFYDEANEELWVKAASSPAGTDIRIVTEDRAFSIASGITGITFNGIEFTQYYQDAIFGDNAGISITDCNIHDVRTNGVYLKKNGVAEITDSTITRCGLNGISAGAIQDYTISGNTINEIGEQDNIGWPIDTNWLKTGGCAIAFAWNSDLTGVNRTPNNGLIELNTMYDLGYIGVLLMGDDNIVRKNIVRDFCEKWNDGGGLYLIHRDSLGSSTKNNLFQNNIVYNGVGGVDGISGADRHAIGIYIDNGCELNTIDNNTVYHNSYYGIMVNWDTQKSTLTDNKVYHNSMGQILYRQDTDALDSPVFPNNDGNICTGNEIAVLNSSQYCIEVVSFNSDSNYNPFSDGGSIDNNYYIAPYQSNICGSRSTSGGALTAYDLSGWRTKLSGDASSVAKTSLYTFKTIENLTLSINATSAAVEVNPGSGQLDLDDSALGSFTLPAFSSRFYRKQTETTSLLRDEFTATNGTNISGRTPAVGPTPTISAGTHTIQSNKLVHSGGGTIMWDLATADVSFLVSSQMTSTSDGMNTYLRYTNDTNRFVIAFTGNEIKLFEFNNSASATNIWTTPFTYATNTDYFIEGRCSGTSIKIYVNQVLMLDVTTALLTGNLYGFLGTNTRNTDYVMAD